MRLEGEFTYEVDGEKVKSVDEFYKLTNNKNYNLVIDGLNIVATSKSEPFFLDEIIIHSFSPKKELEKETYNLYSENTSGYPNLPKQKDEDIKKIKQIQRLIDSTIFTNTTSNNTGGSVFEKVQDTSQTYNGNKITYWGGETKIEPIFNEEPKEIQGKKRN